MAGFDLDRLESAVGRASFEEFVKLQRGRGRRGVKLGG